MPELPEVENFRRLLLPLVSKQHVLKLTRHSPGVPPRKFLSDEDIDEIHNTKYIVTDVTRKGKLIWMELTKKGSSKQKKYLSVHMGMTGRISSPENIPKLMETPDNTTYPPSHTHLKFVAGPCEACFSDPRKFGHILLKDMMDEEIAALAPDAWTELHDGSSKGAFLNEEIVAKLTGKALGIKAILLDQKRAVSGVGNWIADEVLYQTEMHPDQKKLTQEQAENLLRTLHDILETAVACLEKGVDFPEEWLFNYRWTKGSRTAVKDFKGRSITFVTAGGRTSAIVPSIQKLRGQAVAKASAKPAEKKAKKATKTVPTNVAVDEKVKAVTKKTSRTKPVVKKANESVTVPKSKKRKVKTLPPKTKGSRKSPRVSS